MQKHWEIIKPVGSDRQEVIDEIINHLKSLLPDMTKEQIGLQITAELLLSKNITTAETIASFFTPNIDMLHDPYMFTDMEIAVSRILKAIHQKEKITIYGDYDVDGTTATALLFLGLKELNASVDYYIPDRQVDGYGLSLSGLDKILEGGTSLIISVDCGIFAIEEVDIIIAGGVDIIITDHHISMDDLPAATAIINPKLATCPYPFKDLAGVGVAYKLLMGIFKKLDIFTAENKAKYLDLVALGTMADIVSLTSENRTFSLLGLELLKKRRNKGLDELMKISGLTDRQPDTNDVLFRLAPRINAAGRMGSARRAVELLTSQETLRCIDLCNEIEEENTQRQQLDQKILLETSEIISKKYKNFDDLQCIVVASDNWSTSVIGIVASKLAEKHSRPTILISLNEGMGKGSGRSSAGFDLYTAILHTSDLLETFGGHRYAIGLTILPEYIDLFEQRLSTYIKENFDFKNKKLPLQINRKLLLSEITIGLAEWVNRFAPFGVDNKLPVFYSEKVSVKGSPYIVGKNHIKLTVSQGGDSFDFIGYNMGDYVSLLQKESMINIAYTIELSAWKGKKNLQGILKDIAIAGG